MRPTKLSQDTIDRLADAIRLGATWERAADVAGISVATLRDWRRRGEAGDRQFAALLAALKAAEGDGVSRALQVIRQAAEGGQWQAAAWLLERRYPADYGRRVESRVEVSAVSGQDAVAAALARLQP